MKRYLILTLLLLSFLLPSLAQNGTRLPPNATLTVTLNATAPITYVITVPSDLAPNQDLYVRALPTLADPLQVPQLTLVSYNNYKLDCYNAHQEFAGICKIPAKELTKNRTFVLTLKCSTKCTLDLQTYFSAVTRLELGQDLELTAYPKQPEGLTIVILIPVPKDAVYSAISLVAAITNIEQQPSLKDQKVDMLINYGKQNVTDPTDDLFMAQGNVLFTGGQGIYLSQDTIHPGSWIKVYLKLQAGISVVFSAGEAHRGDELVKLGRSYFEFMESSDKKIYSLDLTDKQSELSNKSIELVFDVYSGNPNIVIAFNRNFSQIVPYSRKSSATSYSLSPKLRKNYNFTGSLYISVSASIPSQYYFYTKLTREDVTLIEPYLTYFDQIAQDEVENYLLLERYSFEWGTPSTFVNYTFKIQTVQGKGSFKTKRCNSIQAHEDTQPNLEDCLISTPDQLDTPSFKQAEIQSKQIGNPDKLTIQLDYNIVACSEIKRSKGNSYKQCGFQLIAVNQSPQPFVFSLTVQRKFHTTYLKENTIVKDYLPKNSYIYYAFSLPVLDNVTRLEIFQTTFSGEAALVVSTTQTLPTLQSPFNQIQTHTGEKSKIVLQRNQIAKEIYISVYAYQFTEVNLGIVVHRATDTAEENLNTIFLEKGNLLTYTLEDSVVSFKLNSQGLESIVVSLNELAGHCTFKIFDLQNKQLDCIGKNDNALICQVKTAKQTDYRIEVSGDRGKKNKFTISYKGSIEDCTAATLNQPINVVLHASDSECFTFPVNRNIDLRFVGSFSHSQLTNKQIGVDLYAGDSRIISFDSTHLDIPVRFLSADCPLGTKKPGFVKTCPVSIEFVSNSEHSSSFTFILEEQDAEIPLFDGIVQKVSDLYVQNDGRKHFYYHLYSKMAINIFLTAQTFQREYLLLAKLVDQTTFLNRNEADGVNLYRDYSQFLKDNSTDDNLYSATVRHVGTAILSITRQFISKHCPIPNKEYFLLLSVAPSGSSSQEDFHEPIFYEIEVTQEQTYLQTGDTKTGFIQLNEIYTYLVDSEDAIVNLRNINQQSKQSLLCATVFTLNDNQTLQHYNQYGADLQLKKSDKIDKIYVRGDAEQCSYQISYVSITQPIKTVRLATPYELNIAATDISAFLFYNTQPVSFRVLQMVSAGSADIHILPFNEDNLTLSAVSEMDYRQFPILDSTDGDYVLSSSSEYFCSQCFYYVVVTTKTFFIGQIIFLRLTDAVPLSVGHMFKEILSPLAEIKYEEYVFYSLTDFNIAFNLLQGKIQVRMTNPKGEVEIAQTLSGSKNFTIKAMEYQSKAKIQFFSPKAMYHMRVVAVTDAQFYIRVARAGASQRIFEGFPVTIEFSNKTNTTIEFVNSQQLDKPLTLMANIDSIDQSKPNATYDVKVDFLAHPFIGKQFLSSQDIVTNFDVSNQTLVYSIKNIRGVYFISVQTNLPMKVTFLLVKDQLTHLKPSANHLLKAGGIFELTKIFNCRGDLTVVASKDYDDISDPTASNNSFIALKQPNYAGHYVFGVQNVPGSYFLKVENKNKQKELEYLINYYYYDEINPYDSVDPINYNVNYQLTAEGLNITVNPPVLSDQNSTRIQIKSINYWVYASDQKEHLDRYSRCNIRSPIVEYDGKDSPQIFIPLEQIRIILDVTTNLDNFYLNVQASISVQIVNSSNDEAKDYPTVLTILYNTIEIQPTSIVDTVITEYAYWFTDSLLIFLGWMVLPFALAALFLLYGIKYCLTKLVLYQRDMMVEEEGDVAGGTSQTLPSDVEMNKGDLVQPDSALQNIKEHV